MQYSRHQMEVDETTHCLLQSYYGAVAVSPAENALAATQAIPGNAMYAQLKNVQKEAGPTPAKCSFALATPNTLEIFGSWWQFCMVILWQCLPGFR